MSSGCLVAYLVKFQSQLNHIEVVAVVVWFRVSVADLTAVDWSGVPLVINPNAVRCT